MVSNFATLRQTLRSSRKTLPDLPDNYFNSSTVNKTYTKPYILPIGEPNGALILVKDSCNNLNCFVPRFKYGGRRSLKEYIHFSFLP